MVWTSGLVLWLLAMVGAAAGAVIEPALRRHGIRGALRSLLPARSEPASDDSETPSWAAIAAAAAWDDFYGRTPERPSAKRTSLS